MKIIRKFHVLRRKVADINVNSPSYKKRVISEIKKSKVTIESKEKLLKTASAIRPNSFTWKKSWDKGKLFTRKKKKRSKKR